DQVLALAGAGLAQAVARRRRCRRAVRAVRVVTRVGLLLLGMRSALGRIPTVQCPLALDRSRHPRGGSTKSSTPDGSTTFGITCSRRGRVSLQLTRRVGGGLL